MSQHILLVAVLKEMNRLAIELKSIVEVPPQDWEESYAAYRRQLGLCITEMVNLAKHDLGMRKQDSRVLKATVEVWRAKIAQHQANYPIEKIVLDAPEFRSSFNRVYDCFTELKSIMQDLVERYEVDVENII